MVRIATFSFVGITLLEDLFGFVQFGIRVISRHGDVPALQCHDLWGYHISLDLPFGAFTFWLIAGIRHGLVFDGTQLQLFGDVCGI